jgi:putative SOS response-associated peptidase YedK
MCNNYRALKEAEALRRKYGVEWRGGDFNPEVYPGMSAPIIRRATPGPARGEDADGEPVRRESVLARFGLLPWFAKTEKIAFSTANARQETAATAASYKGPFARRQFCIIPAERFYEPYYDPDRWNAGLKKSERYAIARADGEPLGIAGLWERWKRAPDDPNPLLSFTMLTINADHHPLLHRFHKPIDETGAPNEKRTVVLLRPDQYDLWLDATPAEAPAFFGTFPAEQLVTRPEPAAPRASPTVVAKRPASPPDDPNLALF